MNAQSSSLAQGRGAASLQIGDLQDGNQVLGSLMGNTENHAEATNFPDGLHSPFTHLTYSENQELFDTRPINDSDNLTSMNTSQAVPQQQSNSDFSTAYTFSPRMNTHRVSKSEDEDFVPGSIPSTDSSKKKRSRRKKNVEESPAGLVSRRKHSRRVSQDEYLETTVTKKKHRKKITAIPKIAKQPKQGKKATVKSKFEPTKEDLRLLGSVDVSSRGRSSSQTPVNDDTSTGNMNTGEFGGAIPSAFNKFEKGFNQSKRQFANTPSESSSQPQASDFAPTSNILRQPTVSANSNSFHQGSGFVDAGMGSYEDQYQARVPSWDIFGMQSQMNYPPQTGYTQQNNSSVYQGFLPQQQSFNGGFNPYMNSYASDRNGYQTVSNDFMGQNYSGHFQGFGAQHPAAATTELGNDQTLPLPHPAYNNIIAQMDTGGLRTGDEGGMMMPDFHEPAGVSYQDFTLYDPPNNNNYMTSGHLGNSSQLDELAFQQTIGARPQEDFGEFYQNEDSVQSPSRPESSAYQSQEAQEELEDPSMVTAGLEFDAALANSSGRPQSPTLLVSQEDPETLGHGTVLQHEQPYQPPIGFEAFGPAVQEEQLDNTGTNLGQSINPEPTPALQVALVTSVPHGQQCAKNPNIILQRLNMVELTKAIQQGINWVPPNQYHLAMIPNHQVPVTVDHQLPAVFGQYIFEQCLWFSQRYHERTLANKDGRDKKFSATIVAELRATFGIKTNQKLVDKIFAGMRNSAMVLFDGLFTSSEFLYWDFQQRKPCRIMSLPEFSLLDQPERAYSWIQTEDPLGWARDLIEFVNSCRSTAA